MQDDVAIWYRGANYQLGRGRHGYGIWPLGGQPEYPLEQWPETPQGWAAAWSRFTAIEHPAAIAHLSRPAVPVARPARPGRSASAAGLLAAGMNAGAGFVVGVTTGSFTRPQLEAEPHTHILDSVATLPALL